MKKEQPLMDFNDFGTIKKLLGLGLSDSTSGDNTDADGPATREGQVTPCVFGRQETIEEECSYKRTRLEPLDE